MKVARTVWTDRNPFIDEWIVRDSEIDKVAAADKLKGATEKVTALETAAGKDLKVEGNLKAAETAVTEAATAINAVTDATEKATLEGKFNAAKKTVEEARIAFDGKVDAAAKELEAAKKAFNEEVAKYTEADYTAGTWTTFKGIVDAQTAKVNANDATVQAINEAKTAVVEAAKNLAKKSTDASIAKITVGGKEATADSKDATVYSVELTKGTDLSTIKETVVIATPKDSKAVAGKPVTTDSGKTWTVEVTAENGTKVTYTINVTVAV